MAVQWPRGRAPGFLSGPVCMPACPTQTPQKPTPKWRSYYGFYFPPELPANHLKKRGLKKKGAQFWHMTPPSSTKAAYCRVLVSQFLRWAGGGIRGVGQLLRDNGGCVSGS